MAAETLDQYIARLKDEHEANADKNSLDFFLSQIRELAAKAIPGKDANEEDLKSSAEAAKDAEEKAKAIAPDKARSEVSNTSVIETNSTISRQYYGRMLFFQYDAKLKMKLPYWDRFPLIFVISTKGNTCLGINLHYLPPVERAKLLYNLMMLANSEKPSHQTKLVMTYKLLSTAATLRFFKPCIKRYLLSNIKSKVMVIDPTKWKEVVFMPLANFMKAPQQKVWEDSLNKISNQNKVRKEIP